MMDKNEINKLIEGWTQADREAVRNELLRLHFGIALVNLDESHGTWLMSLSSQEPVRPHADAVISQRCYTEMTSARLIILEPTFEMIEHTEERTFTAAQIEKRWGDRYRTIVPESSTVKRTEHRRLVTAQRSAWTIRSVFVGAMAQFPTQTDISGDLFAPDGKFTLGDRLTPGLDVSLMVRNNTDQALPFNAVIVGKEVRARREEPREVA